jgi:thioredoxin 1
MKNLKIGLLVLAFALAGCSGKKEAKTEVKETSKHIIEASSMKNFNEIINGSTPVLVDFYADWCAPCRMMAPILEQVADQMNGEVRILKVNVDKNSDAAAKYGIRSIPTLMLFQNGQVKWQGVGVIQADQIMQVVKTKAN